MRCKEKNFTVCFYKKVVNGGVFLSTNTVDELSQIVELSYLYDFYGGLLKENHQKIFEDYILNNLSLSEIATEQGITRQGVHDVIKRCSIKLREYEEKLHLVEKFQKTKDKLVLIENISETFDKDSEDKIKRLAKEIYDMI